MKHLDFIEINPPQPSSSTVIWLHGLGADGHDFVPLAEQLIASGHMPFRFLFPHAPLRGVTLNNGYVMRAWYDIYSRNLDHRLDIEGMQLSVALINQLIQQELQRGVASNKIIIAGFSQGAVMALLVGLQFVERLGGIIALSGYFPDSATILANAIHKDLPIFIAHGTDDATVPYFLGEHAQSTLKQHSYLVEWHSYPIGHAVCNEEIHDLAVWLKKYSN